MAIFKSNLLNFRIGMNTLGTLPFRFVFFLLAVFSGFAIGAAETHAQINLPNGDILVSPTGQYPPPLGVPYFNISNEHGRNELRRYHNEKHIKTRLMPVYARHTGEPDWVNSWQYLKNKLNQANQDPHIAENGDEMGMDNDGDGRPEPVFVVRYEYPDDYGNTVYVQSQYRALPVGD